MKLFANGCSWTFGGGLYNTFEEDGSWLIFLLVLVLMHV